MYMKSYLSGLGCAYFEKNVQYMQYVLFIFPLDHHCNKINRTKNELYLLEKSILFMYEFNLKSDYRWLDSSSAFYTDSGTCSASAVVLNSALASSRFLAASGQRMLRPTGWYPRRVLQCVWWRWRRNGYPIIRVLLVVL